MSESFVVGTVGQSHSRFGAAMAIAIATVCQTAREQPFHSGEMLEEFGYGDSRRRRLSKKWRPSAPPKKRVVGSRKFMRKLRA